MKTRLSKKESFVNLIKGNADKKTETRYLVFVLTLFFSGCLIAQLLYPGGFSIFKYYISNQGWRQENPIGCWFFIFGTGFTGILLIPHFLYMHKRLMPTSALLSKIVTICSITGAIGLSLVGFITKDASTKLIHDIVADIAFGGLGASAFFSLFILIRKVMLNQNWPKLYQLIALFSWVIIIGVIMVFVKITTVQQWMGLFTIISWLIGIFLISEE